MKQISDYKGKALVFTKQEDVIQNEFYTTSITEMIVVKDDFHSIWPNLYPNKGLTNKIGHACGIEFLSNVRMTPVYGDEIQTREGLVKKLSGYICYKQGKKRRPDGTWQVSSPVPYEFNWEDRAELDFIADEEKETNKQKYKTPLAKRKHVLELKKFATQRAGTGSELGVIRELTGMNTSFKESELKANNWTLVFSQISESFELQAVLLKARAESIRTGGKTALDIDNAALMLTGKETDVSGDFDDHFQKPETPETKPQDFAQFAKEQTAPTFQTITFDLESGNITISEAYDKIMALDVIKNHEGYENAKSVVNGADEPDKDRAKAYIIETWKGLIS